ncbi:DUF6387 family protein [Pseudomonas nitroreducens]|uniref:DUF6387 family protein n=1 Tax=Pseudomonas nitroreducens TaxID=46680 RepID=UPI000A007D5A|nr:DUF6387 family protein [Pseudomonas nitroreducens]NMZ58306.1 hypothetical protein [Pseudomonas nitroreducens]SNS15390.1 hypothetical protein SAMN05216209_1535 [Pseudomonas nitroreducens]
MEKIDRVEDLPDWFSMENYQAAESFGPLKWYEQLAIRQYLFTLLRLRDQADKRWAKDAAATFERDVKMIRGVDVAVARIDGFFGDRSIAEFLRESRQGVHSLTFRHLREHARNQEDCFDDPGKWFDGLNELANGQDSEKNLDLNTPLTLGTFLNPTPHLGVAGVNLNLPDSVLIESFSKWLLEMRKAQGQSTERRYYRPNFQRWARSGVLPYLDLKVWAQEIGAHIPDRVMAAAIMPRLDFGEGNLRKTVAPTALGLMDDLSELQSLAALEAESCSPAFDEVEK